MLTRISSSRPSSKRPHTGVKGAFGDGKIFVSPVEEVYTISSGVKESGAGELEEVEI